MMINLFKRFQDSERIIQLHLIKDFTIFYLLTLQVRALHFVSFILVLFSNYSEESLETYLYVQSLHGLFLIAAAFINLYIMFYCNDVTTEIVMQGVKTTAFFVCGAYATHLGLSTPFFAPNSVSNAYHIYSPTGRGYGVRSCQELMAVDALKGVQGPRFKPSSLVDNHGMIDQVKLTKQFNGEAILPSFKQFMSKPRI